MPYPFVAAEVLTAANLNAMIGAPTQNPQTGTTYTAVLVDAGKTVTLSNASAVTLTIPAQATVSWADNTQLNFLNIGAGTVTITPAAGVTINGTPLTLAASKGGSLVRTASNTWTFIPFSAGVEAANFTNAATGTFTTGDESFKFLTATGSLSLIVDRAGFADVLVVGGGAGGGTRIGGGGGAGGHLYVTNAYLPEGTITVTVGAGGAVKYTGNYGGNGSASICGNLYGIGGGGGGESSAIGILGGSGGGGGGEGGSGTRIGGAGTSGQGNSGGTSSLGSPPNAVGGGGGGASAVGFNASGSTAGSGGAGLSNSITNSATTRSGGGGGGASGGAAGSGGAGGGGAGTSSNSAATAGTVNTGGGGGAGGFSGEPGGNGAAGGSGVVIIRVRTN